MKIFFSYGHDENTEVVEVMKTMVEKRGHEVWIDKEQIHVGDDWRNDIQKGILESNDVIAFVSEHSTREGGVCTDELKIAVSVKGAVVQIAVMEPMENLTIPASLTSRQALDLSQWKAEKAKGEESWKSWLTQKGEELIKSIESEDNKAYAADISYLKERLQPYTGDSKETMLLRKKYYRNASLVGEINAWLEDGSRQNVLCVFGGPGSGKSMLAANLRYENPNVLCCIFCEADKPQYYNTEVMIRTMAFKIAIKYPEYKTQLMRILKSEEKEKKKRKEKGGEEKEKRILTGRELFENLILIPIKDSIDGGRGPQIIIVDGLDEADESKDEFADILIEKAEYFPRWIKFLLTSRPEQRFRKKFACNEQLEITDNEEALKENISDKLCEFHFSKTDIERIAKKCGNSFVYANLICRDFQTKRITLDTLDSLPTGIYPYFRNLFSELYHEISRYDLVKEILSIICAQFAVSKKMMAECIGVDQNLLESAVIDLEELLVENDGQWQFFHKTIADFLTDKKEAGRFYVGDSRGDQILADYICANMDAVKEMLEDEWQYMEKHHSEHCYKLQNKTEQYMQRKYGEKPDLFHGAGKILTSAGRWDVYLSLVDYVFELAEIEEVNRIWTDRHTGDTIEQYQFMLPFVRYIDCLPDYKYDITSYIRKIKCYIPACNIVRLVIEYDEGVFFTNVLDSKELDKFCIRTERGAELLKESVEYMPDDAKVAFEEDRFQYLNMIYYMDRCIDRCKDAGIPNMEDTISLYEKKRVRQIMSVCGNDFFAGIEAILNQYIGVETEKSEDIQKQHIGVETEKSEDIVDFGSSVKLESAHFACFERICDVEFPDAEMLRSYHTICLALYLANQEKYDDRFAARLIARGASLDIAAWVVKKAYSQNQSSPLLPEREAYIRKLREQYDSGKKELSFGTEIAFGHGFSVRFLTPYICNRLTAQDSVIEGIESDEKELLLVFPIEMPEENSTGMQIGGDDVGTFRFCYEGQENIDAGVLFPSGGYLNRVFSLPVPDGAEKILGEKISVSIETPVGTVKQDLVIGQEIPVNISTVSAGDILTEAQRAIDKRLYGYAYRLLSRGEHSPELDVLRDSLQKKLEPYNCNCNVLSIDGGFYNGHLEIVDGFGVHECRAYAERYVELYGIIGPDQKEHMAIGYIQARPCSYAVAKKMEIGSGDPYYGSNPDRKQFWFLRKYENKEYAYYPVIEEGPAVRLLEVDDSIQEYSDLDILTPQDVDTTDYDCVWLVQLGDTRIELESGTVKEAYLRTCRYMVEKYVADNRNEYDDGLGILYDHYFIKSIENEHIGDHEYEALYEDSFCIRTDLSPSDMADNTLWLARSPYAFRWFKDKEGTQMLLEYIPRERDDIFGSDDSFGAEEDLFGDFDFGVFEEPKSDDLDDLFGDDFDAIFNKIDEE